jgi:hypothetical protein
LLVKIAFTTNLMVGDGKFPDVAQNLMTQPMCMYVYVCVYIYIYIYIYIYTHTHTHTHAYIHTYIEREDLTYISISSFAQGGNSN